MEITMARGDSFEKGVVKKRNDQPDTTAFDEVYFTVKKRFTDREPMFQKTLENGGISSDGNGHYTLFIRPADTDGLGFGEYVFDFEFVKDYYKRTFKGKLILTEEATHVNNE